MRHRYLDCGRKSGIRHIFCFPASRAAGMIMRAGPRRLKHNSVQGVLIFGCMRPMLTHPRKCLWAAWPSVTWTNHGLWPGATTSTMMATVLVVLRTYLGACSYGRRELHALDPFHAFVKFVHEICISMGAATQRARDHNWNYRREKARDSASTISPRTTHHDDNRKFVQKANFHTPVLARTHQSARACRE